MPDEVKRKNFVRLAEVRTKKVLYYIALLSNLSNTNYYSYQKDDYEKIVRAIRNALNNLDKDFKSKFERIEDFRL